MKRIAWGLAGASAALTAVALALAYAGLAAFITAVYVVLVAGVGAAAGTRSGTWLSAVAAAVVAVAFQPVRARAARLANRVVYGRRATPYQVLSDFAGSRSPTWAWSRTCAPPASAWWPRKTRRGGGLNGTCTTARSRTWFPW